MSLELSFADMKKPSTPHHTAMLSNRKSDRVGPFRPHRDQTHSVGPSSRVRNDFLGTIRSCAAILDLEALDRHATVSFIL
jgi:hypothetical protein